MKPRCTVRYVVARNSWSALYIVKQVREGRMIADRVLFRSETEAVTKRDSMRSIHHAAYKVFAVPYAKE